MKKKLMVTLVAASSVFGSGFANTNLLVNTDFSTDEGWITGFNSIVGGEWKAYIQDQFTLDDYVDPSGEGFVFTSQDDTTSDRQEHSLHQEWGAGPVGHPTESIFQTGDVLVFKGKARIHGTPAGSVVMRPFIKTLGYNEFGWEYQIKPDYTEFASLTNDLQEFELSITFPDLTVDDSFQVVQFGFEISTDYVDEAMGVGSIYFQDLEGYVVGTGGETWFGYDVVDGGWVDTMDWLGWVNVTDDPWVISVPLDKHIYVPSDQPSEGGAWMYIPK
jgi:hypothetical protein